MNFKIRYFSLSSLLTFNLHLYIFQMKFNQTIQLQMHTFYIPQKNPVIPMKFYWYNTSPVRVISFSLSHLFSVNQLLINMDFLSFFCLKFDSSYCFFQKKTIGCHLFPTNSRLTRLTFFSYVFIGWITQFHNSTRTSYAELWPLENSILTDK